MDRLKSGLAQRRLRAHDDLLCRGMEHDFAPAHHADLSRLSARVKNKMRPLTDYYQRPAGREEKVTAHCTFLLTSDVSVIEFFS